MITGFNTDVEHEGVVYHVQTEDKGLDTPLILSLVYVGGAILASKRSPYEDLIAKGYDERELSDRLQRQHKLICAAIRAGRIEDLKRMSQREPAASSKTNAAAPTASPAATSPSASSETTAEEKKHARETTQRAAPEESTKRQTETKVKKAAPQKGVRQTMRAILHDVVADFARAEAAADEALHLSLLDEKEFYGGDVVTLNIRVARGLYGEEEIAGADVTVKVLGSTFRPVIFPTRTGPDGIATVRAPLPHFNSGRAAILVRAAANGFEAELRRIIHQG